MADGGRVWVHLAEAGRTTMVGRFLHIARRAGQTISFKILGTSFAIRMAIITGLGLRISEKAIRTI